MLFKSLNICSFRKQQISGWGDGIKPYQTRFKDQIWTNGRSFHLFQILKRVLKTIRECKECKKCGHLPFLLELQLLKMSKWLIFVNFSADVNKELLHLVQFNLAHLKDLSVLFQKIHTFRDSKNNENLPTSRWRKAP